MKIYDVTLPMRNDMLTWPGDAGVSIRSIATVAKDGVALSNFSFGNHSGTHIDAPSHFIQNGATLDEITLEKLIGSCLVLDLTKIKGMEITVADLKRFPITKGSRILFKTGNYKLLKQKTFPQRYISLSLEAAKYLAKKKIFLVGTDFLGIEKRGSPKHLVHKTLLKEGIVLVEGLDLEKVSAGEYQLYCLPLNVARADGAPARVILIK